MARKNSKVEVVVEGTAAAAAEVKAEAKAKAPEIATCALIAPPAEAEADELTKCAFQLDGIHLTKAINRARGKINRARSKFQTQAAFDTWASESLTTVLKHALANALVVPQVGKDDESDAE